MFSCIKEKYSTLFTKFTDPIMIGIIIDYIIGSYKLIIIVAILIIAKLNHSKFLGDIMNFMKNYFIHYCTFCTLDDAQTSINKNHSKL